VSLGLTRAPTNVPSSNSAMVMDRMRLNMRAFYAVGHSRLRAQEKGLRTGLGWLRCRATEKGPREGLLCPSPGPISYALCLALSPGPISYALVPGPIPRPCFLCPLLGPIPRPLLLGPTGAALGPTGAAPRYRAPTGRPPPRCG